MEFSENTYDRIQKYLTDRMKGDDLKSFKKEMEGNPDLAQEVELHKEMKFYLEDSLENNLRKNLRSLGDELDEDNDLEMPENDGGSGDSDGGSAGGPEFNYLWLTVPVLALAAWWFFQSQPTSSPTDPSPEVSSEVTPPPLPESDIIEPDSNTLTEIKEPEIAEPKTPEPKVTPPPPKKVKPKAKEPSLAEDPYAQNPIFESMRNKKLGENNFQLTISRPYPDKSAEVIKYPVILKFSGTLEADENLSENGFKFQVFTNNPDDYRNARPFFSHSLPLENPIDGFHRISYDKDLLLLPGLYYLEVKDADSGKVYYIKDILVNEF